MPFLRPTLAKIRARTTSDFEYELGAQVARVPGTPERGFVQAVAGASHGLHGRLTWIAKNAFCHSAEDEEMARWAAFFGVFRIPATRATGTWKFFAPNGTVIPAGVEFSRDDGTLFETTEEATVVLPDNVNIACRCKVGGTIGNTISGSFLGTLTSPVANVQSNCEEQPPGMSGGLDEESYLSLRTRLLERLDNPPNGGGPGSYVRWAKEVAGVTRVWEYGKVPSLGHVTVLFMRDDDGADPFPSGPECDEVEAKILEYAPLHLAGLHVQAPIEYTLILEIALTPFGDADLEAAVIEAIQSMLRTDAEPAPADGTTFYKSKILTAIGSVAGLTDYKLNVPVGDITLNKWELPTLLNPGVQVTFV